jgi:hypothetical protein
MQVHLFLNLETVVRRARWCAGAGDWREARRPQARACNDARQSQMPAQAYQRVRSALIQVTRVIEGRKISIHVESLKTASGQLRFSGLESSPKRAF